MYHLVRQLKISRMYIFPVLCFRAGLLILIWMASGLLSWSIILKWEMLAWVVVGNAVYVKCICDMTMFFYSIFQTSAGFLYVRKGTIFFWVGPFVDYVLF